MMAPARKQPNKPVIAGHVASPEVGSHDLHEDDGAGVVIALADLMRDSNGEVVLFNDSGLRSLGVATDAAVMEEGEVGKHVTAAGEDVSGFHFIRFEGGLKLFYPAELHLILIRGRSPAQ